MQFRVCLLLAPGRSLGHLGGHGWPQSFSSGGVVMRKFLRVVALAVALAVVGVGTGVIQTPVAYADGGD
ncbi:MAG: hypothetical protein A3J58_00560 [Candidatus Sungbacteria bacterium RIFCSPHIGHO2_02_FULL_52_23]|uniref:Uncharacterized protein n=1 Tax=Candidatus Sungbacteria bacterium RIFCSPHIGHO2_02_FULL_52_23 TaxID=1802274 RepID=A0A1G2KSH9_9BACT|nr:MAG: hypothetical protein A3J58_00560 [Candidatus Sungbacteria bacterium RIFCSPHIGHO2_02_FULL_52_23]